MNERKRKSEDFIDLDFKKCRVTDEITSILHYSHRSRKWTVLCASGDTQILEYHEIKNSPVFQQYIYDILNQTHNENDASYIT